jgi:hypothetical protein
MRLIRKRRKARYDFSSILSRDRSQSLLARNLFAVCFVCVVYRQPVEVKEVVYSVSVIKEKEYCVHSAEESVARSSPRSKRSFQLRLQRERDRPLEHQR